MRAQLLLCTAFAWAGCASTVSPSTEVRLVVDIANELNAELLRIQIFDTDRALVSNELQPLEGLALPLVVPLVPAESGERSYHVVMELSDGAGAPLGTQRVIGAYVQGERRRIRVRFDAGCASTACSGRETCRVSTGTGTCVGACFAPQEEGDDALPPSIPCARRVYVDGASGEDRPDACFGPEAPCRTVGYALDTYLSDRAGGTIDVRGGITYPPFGMSRPHSGTEDTPTRIRAWPGTGRPIIDGDNRSVGINNCCTEDSANHVAYEGLEVVNGLPQGILIHGRAIQDAVVRDCVVRGTTLPQSASSGLFASQAGALVVTNQASNVVVENNVVESNLGEGVDRNGEPIRTFGISLTGNFMDVQRNRIVGSSASGMLVLGNGHRIAHNRIAESGESGIRAIDNRDLVFEDNVVCDSGENAFSFSESERGTLRHNTAIRSAASAVRLSAFSNEWTISRNLFAFNDGSGIARVNDEESVPEAFENLYWMNAAGALENIEPSGTNWIDTVEPTFTGDDVCAAMLSPGSEAATLIDGGAVGARADDP